MGKMASVKAVLLPSVSGTLVFGRAQNRLWLRCSPSASASASASASDSPSASASGSGSAGGPGRLAWSRSRTQLERPGRGGAGGEEQSAGGLRGRSARLVVGRFLSEGGAAAGARRGRSRGGVGGAPTATAIETMGEVAEEEMDPVQQRLMFDDECILVDEKDNVVGHDSKYNCHLMEKIEAENLLHRAFSVFLFNSKNELLLQKRSATKVTFPLVWTNTCCSHPLYRDSELIKENHLGVRNAAQRKLFDELGIEASDAPVDNFTCLGRILYKAASDGKWGEHELDYLVFMKRDVIAKPNPDEVADIMYVNKEQLQELVQKAKAGEDGVKLSPWFQLVVENFLYDWWKRLEEGTLLEVADMETIHKLL